MASYRRRLEGDLERWIAAGLVPAANREAILQTVAADRRLDAATALSAIGAFLAGAAVIAFVAANWSDIPRLVRFTLVLAAFLAAAGGAAWAARRGREVTKNVLLSVAALVFAAAIGLTGQIFDIAGRPQDALHGAGLAAAALALAGRSSWTAAAAVLLIVAGDGYGQASLEPRLWLPWTLAAAPAAAGLSLLWRSGPLAQAAGFAALLVVPLADLTGQPRAVYLLCALLFTALAAGARLVRPRMEGPATVLYGWLVIGALGYFAAAGLGLDDTRILHPVAWLALSGAAVALGRHDGHAVVTAAGVVSLIAAGLVLLFDLGVGLLTAAAVFAGLAVAALVVALALRRRSPA
ncbi:DUF2157 domain-containing protein [Phenylobacterium sp.]|jgi:uncharacterized membrane protein|uniref:DUF2157 domain-containing protein n=1 Tax=Phenylobacterium sp. TaxID=1871053 RepID=UPI002F945088